MYFPLAQPRISPSSWYFLDFPAFPSASPCTSMLIDKVQWQLQGQLAQLAGGISFLRGIPGNDSVNNLISSSPPGRSKSRSPKGFLSCVYFNTLRGFKFIYFFLSFLRFFLCGLTCCRLLTQNQLALVFGFISRTLPAGN